MNTKEHERLAEVRDDGTGWRRWGPYVSDRSWATVREDYSSDGEAWDYLIHDLARSKAYRWGEDGIAGICDRYQFLVFAPAFWNGRDPILKERLFGLTPREGNHGEDVKEYYFHLDNTPTHSYMRFLYKYPQAEYPYCRLIEENQNRHGLGFEFELLDTCIFDEDRYFDMFVDYAKISPEDMCIRIEAVNRGPEPAPLHILPHLWFRNSWAWGSERKPEPIIAPGEENRGVVCLVADDTRLQIPPQLPSHARLGQRALYAPAGGVLLFTDNETNAARFTAEYSGSPRPFTKDAFHRHIIQGELSVNPGRRGTKAAIHYRYDAIPPGGSAVLRLRLSDQTRMSDPLGIVDELVAERRAEADEFYAAYYPPGASEDERLIFRQAVAGTLWTKQCYIFDVNLWIKSDVQGRVLPQERPAVRNLRWKHLNSYRIMSVPDKWEYPWFAAWDLAFQCVTLALVDFQFAKDQLWFLLFEQFQHPNGQIPAYEWEFSDLNPPVHAWAVWRVYSMEKIRTGKADRAFLEKCFHKLLINFTWWINRVDREDNNIFEGGFLGLDNITVVDRSKSYDGATLEQADGTGWMAMFCLNLMRIALELAEEDPVYEGLATKFFQHYVYVAAAMKHMGGRDFQLWDADDEFFYDVLRYPDGSYKKFRVRSLVGLIPVFAVERLQVKTIAPFKDFARNVDWFLENRRDLVSGVVHSFGQGSELTHVLSVVDIPQLLRLMARVWDPGEFLSDFGIRSLSKAHQLHPFELDGKYVAYEPAEAVEKIKGGNSNWRGPIWYPTCFLLIEALRKIATACGPSLAVSLPGNRSVTFPEMARDLADRLIRIFLRGANGRRPVFGGTRKFQDDPHWRDYLLFYEYFHGDNGAGLGASHQTGWTALVASLIDEWRR
jgi:hypothetical protein